MAKQWMTWRTLFNTYDDGGCVPLGGWLRTFDVAGVAILLLMVDEEEDGGGGGGGGGTLPDGVTDDDAACVVACWLVPLGVAALD
jgi:hypothetical protein